MNINQPVSTIADKPTSRDPIDHVIHYHLRTKHHFNRYARALGYLDWANQPDPFRRFKGAELIRLPLLKPDEEPLSPVYDAIYESGMVERQPINLRTLSRFFEFALALSAWKRAGQSEWALRSNPSSGNLHPTEGYIILSHHQHDLKPGLYHYAPKEHGLELRAMFSPEVLDKLLEPFPLGAFLFGWTSVQWREAWKYGERAFRYCHHDVGHAIGTARIGAATLGWSMALLDAVDQNTVAMLLGTDRTGDFLEAEAEHPDCLAVLWPSGQKHTSIPLFLEGGVVQRLVDTQWFGKANRLSGEHGVHWDIIDEVSEATWKMQTEKVTMQLSGSRTTLHSRSASHRPQTLSLTAGQIIRQRRSAVALDAKTSITATTFYRMLERVMPHGEAPQAVRPMPWDVWPYSPAIHLMLFVHRVEGLNPGLYFLLRDPARLTFVQQSTNAELTWSPAPGCPNELPLYWLLEGDAKRLAAQVSCHQDIAGDGAFSFGMLADFEGTLRERGAWWYPRLFWESGLLGQVLYLEAEAAGVRATGIGCFFDDPVHEIISVKELSLQSLYHFTLGGALEDRRLMTLPPYSHLR
jgi:SagB-type dehydrogenase family enzyme